VANFTGTTGDDIFTGGSDADTLLGNGGNDTLAGGGGNDLLVGGAGADKLDGGDGSDTLYAGVESPQFNLPYYGNPWTAPVLDTGSEHDVLKGGEGDDRLFAGYGDDVDGGGNGYSGDYLYISFQGATAGVTFDGRLASQAIGGGTITGIENISWIQGGNFDDDINAGSAGTGYSDFTAVFGMGGNDKLVAGYYTGTLFGGDGNDIVDGRNSGYLQAVDGGAGDDVLYTNSNSFGSAYGGDGADTIYAHELVHGGAGNDKIVMQFSYYRDWVYGDEGDDDIQAASSGNTIAGGAGADKIYGDVGADTLYSGDRNINGFDALDDMGREHDILAGFGGDDTLAAGYGDDVDGGSGADTLRLSLGGAASAVTFDTAGIVSGQPFTYAGGTISNVEKLVYLRGSEFADTLKLATQAELLSVDSGAGDDVITSANSSVSVKGGAGDDRFVSGQAGDIFDGGAGFDTVDYGGYASAVTVSLAAQSGAGGDQLLNVEAVIGSAFADTLTGDAGANTLRGGGGNDALDGGGGTDTAQYLGASTDYSWTQGSDGAWTVKDLRAGAADGVDTLKGIEQLKFSDKLVQLSVPPVTNIINGSSGADTLFATSANDIIDGGAGTDTVQFSGASTDFSWTQGSDASWTVKDLRAGSPEGTDILKNVEQLKFTDKIVVIVTPPANVILGTEGSDNLYGTPGDDVMRGGGGMDFLWSTPGNDTYDGGDGRDSVDFYQSAQGVRVDLAILGQQNTGEGNDTFVSIDGLGGSVYNDVLYGDDGANSLGGNNGDDQLDGRGGEDSIGGDAGNDIIHGGAGNDNLNGGSGNDVVYGDAGDDQIWLASENGLYNMGSDVIDGGDGLDTVQVAFATFGVSINLGITGQQPFAPGLTLSIKNVERLFGGDYGDKLTGDAGDNVIGGYNGDDVIDGGAGQDTVYMRGYAENFAVTWTANGWQIADKRTFAAPGSVGTSYEGVDLVKNVEFIQYYDKTVALGDGMTFVVGNILRQAGASATATDLSGRLGAGALTGAQAVSELVTKAGATTSVATLAYEFFTGKIPGQAGIDYLVSPTGPNANNLNSAYFQSFNLENRYINFAVNLGKLGEGKDAFAAKYGTMSLFDATREVYKTIFGAAPTDEKIHALIDTRTSYFATYGGDGANGIGTKAAMAGWLLAEAQKADLGVMVKSNDAWLTDLADGSAPFAIDILDPAKGYYKTDFVFGGQ
jgi:Ca2+-binding RTX toxin-like protein